MEHVDSITQEAMAQTEAVSWLQNLSEVERRATLEASQPLIRVYARGFVGLRVAVTLLFCTLLYLGTRILGPDRRVPSLSRFRPWDGMVWIFIFALAAVLLVEGQVALVGWNLLIFTALVYWVRGLGVIDHQLVTRSVPLGLRGLAIAIVATVSHILFFLPVCAVGLFDTWFDFRHLSPDWPGAVDEGGGHSP